MEKFSVILDSFDNMLDFIKFHVEGNGLCFESEVVENAQNINTVKRTLLGKNVATIGFFEKIANIVPYNSSFLSELYTTMYQKEVDLGDSTEDNAYIRRPDIPFIEVGDLYYNQKKGITEIAKIFNCKPQIIQSRLYKYEEEFSVEPQRTLRKAHITCEMCIEEMLLGKSIHEVAVSIGCTDSFVKSRLKVARAKYGKYYERYVTPNESAKEKLADIIRNRRDVVQYEERCKEVFELKQQGLSGSKIAEKLGIPLTTVNHRLSKCKQYGWL